MFLVDIIRSYLHVSKEVLKPRTLEAYSTKMQGHLTKLLLLIDYLLDPKKLLDISVRAA